MLTTYAAFAVDAVSFRKPSPADVSSEYAVSPDGRTLTVWAAAGDPVCEGELGEPEVRESPSTVTVTLMHEAVVLFPLTQGCNNMAYVYEFDVSLSRTLGDRRVLLDGGGTVGQLIRGEGPPRTY